MLSFHLSDEFVNQYKTKTPPFGFNGLGEIVYERTYSRIKEDGFYEEWYETVRRVVEGTYSIQKNHINEYRLGWKEAQGQKSAEEMYERIFNMKFLPPGRGLWSMGTSLVHEKKLCACLSNCGFVSTKDIERNPSYPFEFLMDASMLGVGVGFDTKGSNKIKIIGPNLKLKPKEYEISDDREGWVKSLKLLLDSYFENSNEKNLEEGKKEENMNEEVIFDYSRIRSSGKRLKTFGGLSSGSKPLEELHQNIRKLLDKEIGNKLSSTTIVDIFNMIGKCVVSGNINRIAELSIGSYEDEEYLDLKNYERHPERKSYGWTSNNCIFGEIGMSYKDISKRICNCDNNNNNNGEPLICWLENMQKYGRLCDGINHKDIRVEGCNPCLEESLESYEICSLVETFPFRHENKEDFLRTLKFAYLYGKTVTLCMTHWPDTNRVMLRNRRIGCSVSGISQFLSKNSLNVLKDWLDSGYKEIQKWDDVYSEWFCIPKSIKTTCVKPSGTVSLLAGATPGMHCPESRFYIRKIIIDGNNDLIERIKQSGYTVNKCIIDDNNNVENVDDNDYNNTERNANLNNKLVNEILIPIDVGENVRTLENISMYEQLNLASFLQEYWSDNMVSCSVYFDPDTEGKLIEMALDFYQYQLKGIRFIPDPKDKKKVKYNGPIASHTIEVINEEKYNEMKSKLKMLNFSNRKEDHCENIYNDSSSSSDVPQAPSVNDDKIV